MKSILAMMVALGFVAMQAQASGGKCGHMYWSVKTGTDSRAGDVDLTNIVPITGQEMFSWAPPANLNTRTAPHETTVYQITGTLVQIYFSQDSDEHMLIKDSIGTLITAEIPSPDCVGASSPFLPGITSARQTFDSQFSGSTGQQIDENIPVTVTGVGFFDDPHSPDCAPNGIELHPVLSLKFGSSQ